MADNVTDLIRRARELAKLAEGATPGPWLVESPGRVYACEVRHKPSAYLVAAVITPYKDTSADARLIAAAPDMARLLVQLADELERLREENARLRASTFYECPECGATCMGRD